MPPPLGDQPDSKAIAHVRAILDLCESQGTSVIVFIGTSYVDLLEGLDLSGYWTKNENWKRSLLSLISHYPTGGGGAAGAGGRRGGGGGGGAGAAGAGVD